MSLREMTVPQRSSEVSDPFDRTSPVYQTKNRTVLVAGRSATIRQILCIILSTYGYKVIEVDHLAAVASHTLPDDVRLVLIDAEPDLFPEYELDELDKLVAEDVPVIVLTDDPDAGPERNSRTVVRIPKLFTWERIASIVQALTSMPWAPALR
jgi:DNA-binding NtrC family response regulator